MNCKNKERPRWSKEVPTECGIYIVEIANQWTGEVRAMKLVLVVEVSGVCKFFWDCCHGAEFSIGSHDAASISRWAKINLPEKE